MDPLTFALGLSLHIGFDKEYNAIHPHIRYQNEGLIAGAYYNSISQPSLYLGTRLEKNDFGLELGAVSGYSKRDPLKPTAYLRATYKNYFVAPSVGIGDTGVVLGTELKF